LRLRGVYQFRVDSEGVKISDLMMVYGISKASVYRALN